MSVACTPQGQVGDERGGSSNADTLSAPAGASSSASSAGPQAGQDPGAASPLNPSLQQTVATPVVPTPLPTSAPLSQNDFYDNPSATIAITQGGGNSLGAQLGCDSVLSDGGYVSIYLWQNSATQMSLYLPYTPAQCSQGAGSTLICGTDALDQDIWTFQGYAFTGYTGQTVETVVPPSKLIDIWRYSDPGFTKILYTATAGLDARLAALGYTVKTAAPFQVTDDPFESDGHGWRKLPLVWYTTADFSADWQLDVPDSCAALLFNEMEQDAFHDCAAAVPTFGGLVGLVLRVNPACQ